MKEFFYNIYFKFFTLSPLLISREIKNEWTILDVGCGRSSILRLVKKGSYRVGLDFYEPYILESEKSSIHDKYVLGDARVLPFKSNHFDCAVANGVLEHLEKQDGLKMIREMERVAKKKIILTTPNGFLPAYAGPEDNPEERHLSGWTIDELKKLGFKVRGSCGLKTLWTIRNGQAVLKFKPKILSVLLLGITELFVYHFPSLAFELFFVKDLRE